MLAFVHVEKAAGTTIVQILRRSYGMRHCNIQAWRNRVQDLMPNDLRTVRWLHPGLASITGHIIKPYNHLEKVDPKIRFYTILREPLTRCASHYQHQVQRMGVRKPFPKWIAAVPFQDFMTRKMAGRADVELAKQMLRDRFIFVGLLEKFDESLVMLRRAIGRPRLDIRYTRERVAADNSIKKQVMEDPECRALLQQHNQLDAELYRYVSEELYPRQREDYGPSLADDLAAFQADRMPPERSLVLLTGRVWEVFIYHTTLGLVRAIRFRKENRRH
jgi:hypothetical protein